MHVFFHRSGECENRNREIIVTGEKREICSEECGIRAFALSSAHYSRGDR